MNCLSSLLLWAYTSSSLLSCSSITRFVVKFLKVFIYKEETHLGKEFESCVVFFFLLVINQFSNICSMDILTMRGFSKPSLTS